MGIPDMTQSVVARVIALFLLALGVTGCTGVVVLPSGPGGDPDPGDPDPSDSALVVQSESITTSYSGFFSVILACTDGETIEVDAPGAEPMVAGGAFGGTCTNGRFVDNFFLPAALSSLSVEFRQTIEGSIASVDLRRQRLPSDAASLFFSNVSLKCLSCHSDEGGNIPYWGAFDSVSAFQDFISQGSGSRFPNLSDVVTGPRDLRAAPGAFLRRLVHRMGDEISPIFGVFPDAGSMPPVGSEERRDVEVDFSFFDLAYAFLANLSLDAVPNQCLDSREPVEERPVVRLTNEELHRTVRGLFALQTSLEGTVNPLPGVTAEVSTYMEGLAFPALPPSGRDTIFETLLNYGDEVASAFELDRYNAAFATAVGCSLATDSDATCVQAHIENLLARAFRGEAVPADTVTMVVDAYGDFRIEMDAPTAFVNATAKYILVSPFFLFKSYRGENSAVAGVHSLTNRELASRVSFLIWGTGPTPDLLARDWDRLLRSNSAQVAGELEDILLEMLRDSRSDYFFKSFGFQWLHVTEELRPVLKVEQMGQAEEFQAAIDGELIAMLRHVAVERRPLDELLTADYTFLNRTMAEWYGMDPSGFTSAFQRVAFADHAQLYNRRGILTQAKVLSAGSVPSRPNAANRGARIIRHVACSPLGNPSGFIIEPGDGVDIEATTEAQLFRDLTEDPNSSCAGCHLSINPIGYPFHAFNRLGQHDSSQAVNGSLPEPYVYENVVVRGQSTDNPSPVWKAQLFYLDDRGGSLVGLPTKDTSLSGTFDDHLGLIDLLATSRSFEACIVEHLYDYTRGFPSSSSMGRDQTTISAHACTKSAIVEEAPDFLSLLRTMVARPGFTEARRN